MSAENISDSSISEDPFEHEPARLLVDTTSTKRQWHEKISDSCRTSPWFPMATTLLIGTLCIRTLSPPALVRRHAAILGIFTAYRGWSQYVLTHSAIRQDRLLRWQDARNSKKWPHGRSVIDVEITDLIESGYSEREAALLWQDIWNGLPCEIYSFAESEDILARKKLGRRVAYSVGGKSQILDDYRERDRRLRNKLELNNRIGYEWRRLWSSAECRAGLEHLLLLTLPKDAFSDEDIGRCSMFFANLLELDWPYETFAKTMRITDGIVNSSIFAGFIFTTPWVLWPAGVVGLCALAWSTPLQLRYVQDTEEHLRYSSPLKSILHMAMTHRIDLERLKAEAAETRAARSDPVVGEEGVMRRDSPIDRFSSEP